MLRLVTDACQALTGGGCRALLAAFMSGVVRAALAADVALNFRTGFVTRDGTLVMEVRPRSSRGARGAQPKDRVEMSVPCITREKQSPRVRH